MDAESGRANLATDQLRDKSSRGERPGISKDRQRDSLRKKATSLYELFSGSLERAEEMKWKRDLFITSVIILYNNSSGTLLFLFLGSFTSFIRSVRLLYRFRSFIQLPLFMIRQRQVRKITHK